MDRTILTHDTTIKNSGSYIISDAIKTTISLHFQTPKDYQTVSIFKPKNVTTAIFIVEPLSGYLTDGVFIKNKLLRSSINTKNHCLISLLYSPERGWILYGMPTNFILLK